MSAIALSRSTFQKKLKGTSLDTETLKKDSRLKGVDIDKADLDGDGKISGKKETKALFREIDSFDKDGKASSVNLVLHDGRAAQQIQPKIDAIADAAKVSSLRTMALVNGPRGGNDDIMHVGMRDINKLETDALGRSTKRKGQRLVVVGSKGSKVENGGKDYDLSKPAEIASFSKSLGLPKTQTDKIAKAIKDSPLSGRDELAGIAKEWSKAEKGGRIPSRMIISGHSVGGDFWGDRGDLDKASVIALADAMPVAASQIEDLHLSGCYCLGRASSKEWLGAFPNLRTMMAYDKKAPASDQGAPGHQASWEQRTRGRTNRLSRSVAKGAVVWTKKGGFDDGKPTPSISTLRGEVRTGKSTFNDHFDGSKVQARHSQGPLRDYYTSLTDLIEHPSLPKAERNKLKKERDVTIRLIYYDVISQRFQKERGASVADGYKAAGKTAPDFSKLSRKEALKKIDQFLLDTAKSTSPKVRAARAQLEALESLDPSGIPRGWI